MESKKRNSLIIGITIFMFGILNTINTPYVFDGYFMNGYWDYVSIGLLLILFIEINTLGIKSFPIIQRVNLLLFTGVLIFAYFYNNDRVEYLVYLGWIFPTCYILVKDYIRNYKPKTREYPRNRMVMIFALGVFFIILPIGDFNVINDITAILYGVAVGIIITILMFLIMILIKYDMNKGFLIVLSTLIASPLISFLLIIGINYALDTSEPQIKEYEIIELDVDTGFRQPTTYEVYFEIDDKSYHVGVEKDLYYQLEVGDNIDIFLYEGFFKLEYMLNE